MAVDCHGVCRALPPAGMSGPGSDHVVVGGGPVGILIALVARAPGSDVRVVGFSAQRRLLAGELGLGTLDPAVDDLTGLVGQVTADAGAGVAFEVPGAAAGVDTAVDVLGVRGRSCLGAIRPRPREINPHRLFRRELTLVGAHLYDRTGSPAQRHPARAPGRPPSRGGRATPGGRAATRGRRPGQTTCARDDFAGSDRPLRQLGAGHARRRHAASPHSAAVESDRLRLSGSASAEIPRPGRVAPGHRQDERDMAP
ncbi:zinc-binding dehydrogenase [Streptomyces sp. SID12501]|uniref:Zinc-binding dehydrogenase n=1 Tax=Streptomyces sp. SID12501 TaxID=2706042 RepID=A0A6B3BMP6_9ACTN|nr:zinc-binding dehydrogenase [Streptomyces sp. SID12501]